MNFLKDFKNEMIKTAKFNFELYRRTSSGEDKMEVVSDLADRGLLPLDLHVGPITIRPAAATANVEESKSYS